MTPPTAPDSTAVRVALWRALHVEQDLPPVFDDVIGLQLAAPPEGWRERPDMNPQFTRVFRASIVARARFIEDLLQELGLSQYVLLGAGLDSFAQRRPELARRLRVFEVDQPRHIAWKRQRLRELGYPITQQLVPVDFEAGDSWLEKIRQAGFDPTQAALVTSTGVSMYLSHSAIEQLLREAASLAPGSVFVMTFLLPIPMADPEIQPGLRMAEAGAQRSGTPFISYFKPEEIMTLARRAGFSAVEHVSAEALGERYFAGRADGLRPPRNTEEILLARV